MNKTITYFGYAILLVNGLCHMSLGFAAKGGTSSSAPQRLARPVAVLGAFDFFRYRPRAGLVGFYNFDENQQVGGSFAVSNGVNISSNSSQDGFGFYSSELSGYEVKAFWSYFFGESFHITTGLGQTQDELNYRFHSLDDSGRYIEGTVNTSTTTLNGSIGNLWQYSSGIVWGGEWLELSQTIGKSSSGHGSGNLDPGPLSSGIDKIESFYKKEGHQNKFSIAKLLIGYSF